MTRIPSPARSRLNVGMLLGLIGVATGCSTVRYTEAFTPDAEVSTLLVQVDQGNVEVVVSDEIWVERTIRAAEGTLDLSHDVVDGELRLQAACTTPIPCAVDTVVHVPADLPVVIELGSGEVVARDLEDLSVQVGEGTVDAQVEGRFHASVAQGELRVYLGAGSVADVAVGQGTVDAILEPDAWALELSGSEVDQRGVEHTDGAAGRLTAMAPGGQIRVSSEADVARR